MKGRRSSSIWTMGALAALTLSCASARVAPGGEKGLVAAPIAKEKLDAAFQPRRIALVVGVGAYDDRGWSPLRFPEKDADDLAAVLRDRERGAFDDVIVLRGATRAELLAGLDRLAAANRNEQDTVVVYVSAHGTLARDGRGELHRYLVTRDARLRDVPGTALSMDALRGAFDRLRSRRKVLILAACHSGAGKSILPEAVQRELAGTKAAFLVKPIEDVSRASVLLAASDWGETAREDAALRNDIYTHFLVEALRAGADRNGDGAVTVSEAHDYARRRTYEFTEGRQRPSAESSEVGADPIVLVGRVERRGRPELYSYAPRLDGFTVAVDGRPVAELPGGLSVEPGTRRVQLAKGAGPALLDVPLRIGPGERIDLERLVLRSEGPWEIAPRLALMGFLDSGNRDAVLGTAIGAGVAITRRDWPAGRFSLRLDVTGAAGRSRVEAPGGDARFSFTAFNAGLSLPWRFQPFAERRLSLLAGPRVALVRIDRRFGLDLAERQSMTAVTPGALLGIGWDQGRWTLGAEAQLDWMMTRVDEQDRSAGFGQLLLGAGWRW